MEKKIFDFNLQGESTVFVIEHYMTASKPIESNAVPLLGQVMTLRLHLFVDAFDELQKHFDSDFDAVEVVNGIGGEVIPLKLKEFDEDLLEKMKEEWDEEIPESKQLTFASLHTVDKALLPNRNYFVNLKISHFGLGFIRFHTTNDWI
eukprot:TRINITY_DN11306_c0_g2_i1.p1 TRINITY_DN11306_c0_g2~~TRINITY_DN11306_c0_g2_i1.p1  ORF type:complete len:148 (+),score=53.89 TRINITY_DN11306_c0_g2_i1:194-637(+)